MNDWPKRFNKELKVTIPNLLKKIWKHLKPWVMKILLLLLNQTSKRYLIKDTILKMLDDENYYTQNGGD